ncbi:MAG TPA: ABC transporter ATP-binding protein [Solirubrobacter sp.]|nr:ABC transporter ATP-binding protein [Solirubrobacter sp.]
MRRSRAERAPEDPILAVEDLHVRYGPIAAVRGISLTVGVGETVCLLGANGAGKTTTLGAIAGLLRSAGGSVRFAGARITGARPASISRRGIGLVPEGRRVFASLSVEDNLVAGTFAARGREHAFEHVYELFPVLAKRRRQRAATLSGGEQQMLAIGRALAGAPSLLLLDEPSMGLAPRIVESLYESIAAINAGGTTVLLVEQNVRAALGVANRGYVMAAGEIVAEGTAGALRDTPAVQEAYFGGAAEEGVKSVG